MWGKKYQMFLRGVFAIRIEKGGEGK